MNTSLNQQQQLVVMAGQFTPGTLCPPPVPFSWRFIDVNCGSTRHLFGFPS